MTKGTVVVSSFLLSLAVLGVGSSNTVLSVLDEPPAGPTSNEPHGRIHLTSDGDLLLPEAVSKNGVRRGWGTAEDPYVIEDWSIPVGKAGDGAAIWVQLTTKHLLIRNIQFTDVDPGGIAVWADFASNLRIEGLTVDGMMQPIFVSKSQNIDIRNASFLGNSELLIEGSDHVRVSDVSFAGPEAHATALDSRVNIRRASFESRNTYSGVGVSAIHVGGSSDPANRVPADVSLDTVTIRNYSNFSSRGGIQVHQASLTARDVNLTDNGRPLQILDGRALLENVQIIGETDGTGIELSGGQLNANRLRASHLKFGVRSMDSFFSLRNSTFQENGVGIRTEGSCSGCSVTNSEFLANREADVHNAGSSEIVATENWWGDPKGPLKDHVLGNVRVQPVLSTGTLLSDQQRTGVPGLGLLEAVSGICLAFVMGRGIIWGRS